MICSQVIPMTVYYAVCVNCGISSPPGFTVEDAETFARRAGWIKLDDLHYCVDHARAAESRYKRDKALIEFFKQLQEFSEKHKGDPPPDSE